MSGVVGVAAESRLLRLSGCPTTSVPGDVPDGRIVDRVVTAVTDTKTTLVANGWVYGDSTTSTPLDVPEAGMTEVTGAVTGP